MTAVAKILQSKPEATVYSIGPSDSVFDALRLMADKGIGALLVMEGGQVLGRWQGHQLKAEDVIGFIRHGSKPNLEGG